MAYSFVQLILDIIYPVRCPICKKVVSSKEIRICEDCRKKLPYIQEPRCKKCSKPIMIEEKEYCKDCEHKKYHFIKGYSLWIYDEVMRQSLADFKYHNKKENARFYSSEILLQFEKQMERMSVDAIVPVPIHKSKYRERSYNQAEILAKEIGRKMEIPVISDLLIRTKKTLPQKQLSDKERLKNLEEAFAINPLHYEVHSDRLKKILLVDDIYTTGSTIEACTKVLIQHGFHEVFFVTVCIGKGF